MIRGRTLLALALLPLGCGGGPSDEEEERPVPVPTRVANAGGQTVVVLDEAGRERAGIAAVAVAAVRRPAEVEGWASVLDTAVLAASHAVLLEADTRLTKARIALDAAGREHARVAALAADGQNESQRTLDAATATWDADRAEVAAASSAIAARAAEAHARWGGVIAAWLEHGSPELDRLLGGRERLLLVTLPADAGAPASVTVAPGPGETLTARLVGPAAQLDPRLPGPAALYRAPADPRLLPGATAAVRAAVGAPRAGVVVPYSAVVWWDGEAWVYVERAPGSYVRRRLEGRQPAADGWFVPAGAATAISAGERVVTSGAESLLTEELRATIRGSEG